MIGFILSPNVCIWMFGWIRVCECTFDPNNGRAAAASSSREFPRFACNRMHLRILIRACSCMRTARNNEDKHNFECNRWCATALATVTGTGFRKHIEILHRAKRTVFRKSYLGIYYYVGSGANYILIKLLYQLYSIVCRFHSEQGQTDYCGLYFSINLEEYLNEKEFFFTKSCFEVIRRFNFAETCEL